MPDSRILLGVVGRPHGVRGQVRIVSYTADPASLAEYGPLCDDAGRRFTLRWRREGIAEVAEIVGETPVAVSDRNAAERLTNTRLYTERDRLPAPDEDEFYLADLVGLTVVDGGPAPLGTVAAVHDYGAGASLEIAPVGNGPPVLLPFTRACVPEVDLASGRLVAVMPHEVEVREDAAG